MRQHHFSGPGLKELAAPTLCLPLGTHSWNLPWAESCLPPLDSFVGVLSTSEYTCIWRDELWRGEEVKTRPSQWGPHLIYWCPYKKRRHEKWAHTEKDLVRTWRAGISKAWNKTNTFSTLTLDFQAPELWGNKLSWLKPPSLWYFATAAPGD